MKTKNIKYIYYTGICANNRYIHTIDEFINSMLKVNEVIDKKYIVRKLHKMNLMKWIRFSGALIVYE